MPLKSLSTWLLASLLLSLGALKHCRGEHGVLMSRSVHSQMLLCIKSVASVSEAFNVVYAAREIPIKTAEH